jgi:hypothetical protein
VAGSKQRGSRVKAGGARLKALPWAALARVSVVIGRRWTSLAPKERERLTRLVRESRGRPGNLSDGERKELRKLVDKLDLKGAGRELLPLVRGGRGKRR